MRWVLKVGGSLCQHKLLPELLTHTADLSKSDVCTIVPGGGPFADHIRDAQKYSYFDDSTAHQMALLAMRQYGYLLADLAKLPLQRTENQVAGQCAVWLPTDDLDPPWYSAASSLPLDWDFSSDSIAACFASYIGAQWLILLKSVSLSEISAVSKLVDKRFIPLIQTSRLKCACVSPRQWLQLSHTDEFSEYQMMV